MELSSFFNNKSLNSKFSDLLLKYDSNQDGFSRKEFSTAVYGISGTLLRGLLKISNIDKNIFTELDTNYDKNVSYEEMAIYIKNEYNLDFYSFKDMTLREICDAITIAQKTKTNNENSQIDTAKIDTIV